MLRVLSSARKLCDGMTRRDLLRIGGLGLAGLSLADLVAWQTASAAESVKRPKSFGRALDHSHSLVRLAEPDRIRRSQARCTAGDSWRLGFDPVELAGLPRVRAVADLRASDGSHDGAAFDDAPLSIARCGLRIDGRADA